MRSDHDQEGGVAFAFFFRKNDVSRGSCLYRRMPAGIGENLHGQGIADVRHIYETAGPFNRQAVNNGPLRHYYRTGSILAHHLEACAPVFLQHVGIELDNNGGCFLRTGKIEVFRFYKREPAFIPVTYHGPAAVRSHLDGVRDGIGAGVDKALADGETRVVLFVKALGRAGAKHRGCGQTTVDKMVIHWLIGYNYAQQK